MILNNVISLCYDLWMELLYITTYLGKFGLQMKYIITLSKKVKLVNKKGNKNLKGINL